MSLIEQAIVKLADGAPGYTRDEKDDTTLDYDKINAIDVPTHAFVPKKKPGSVKEPGFLKGQVNETMKQAGSMDFQDQPDRVEINGDVQDREEARRHEMVRKGKKLTLKGDNV